MEASDGWILRGDFNPPVASHQLPGATRADAEEFFDGLAVQVGRVHAAEDVENFRKSMKARKLARQRECPLLLQVRE